MEESDFEKYVLDQAKIEVEHTRSWPTKVMAFYVAINFGLAGALIALRNKNPSFVLPCYVQFTITALILVLAGWIIKILYKNHINYLTYRKVQINFQQKFCSRQNEYCLPNDWFEDLKVSGLARRSGWLLYVYIVLLVAFLVFAVVWWPVS